MENTLVFTVEGMTCGGCARTVRQALEALPGVVVDRVVVGEPVQVRLADGGAGSEAVVGAVAEAGYRPVVLAEE